MTDTDPEPARVPRVTRIFLVAALAVSAAGYAATQILDNSSDPGPAPSPYATRAALDCTGADRDRAECYTGADDCPPHPVRTAEAHTFAIPEDTATLGPGDTTVVQVVCLVAVVRR
ncbi:hypothetical protein [Streptomyces sp. NPDC090053]|uniref:hypothetical protein n=1 Tax=Streptomyces sp. NPDC090053 TaxID=3365932 RepID=UPI0038248494